MALLALSRKKQALAPDVRGLVKSLTGLEDDKHIQEFENYIFSNLLHYQQPMVDGFNVQKSIDGLVQKLYINGFPEKGKKLKGLVDIFIASTLFKDNMQTGVEWYVLQLLVKLAYKPTDSIDDNSLPVSTQLAISPEESFDWGAYLKEGWEQFQLPDDDEDSDEHWTIESEEDSLSNAEDLDLPVVNTNQGKFKAVGSVSTSSIPNPTTWKKKVPPNETKQEAVFKIIKESTDSEVWLKNNIQNSWWEESSKYKENVSSKLKSANFSEIWNQYQKNTSSSTVKELLVISEYKVLKEILWMFQVPTNTVLFSQDENGKHKVKKNVTIPSLSQDSLQCILTGLCPYFDKIYDLKTFKELLKEDENEEEKPPPFTYKAFCAALMEELDRFIQVVVDIETKVDKQDQSNTVISVIADLDPALNQLNFVHKVYKKCVIDWKNLPCWVCSTRLLSELYGILLTPTNNILLGIALDLFIASFSVYLNIIDTWLCEGHLEDWRGEFIVCRNGEDLDIMPYEVEMKNYGVTPVTFLSKLVHMVKDAGRSMTHIIKLDKLHILRKSAHNKGNLFKEFVENLNQEFEKLLISIHSTSSVNVNTIGNENPVVNLLSSHNELTDFAVKEDLPDNYQNKSLGKYNIFVEHIDVETADQQKQNEFNQKQYLCGKNTTTICNDKITIDETMHKLTTLQLIDNPFLSKVFEEYLNENTVKDSIETTVQLHPYRSAEILDMICVHQVLEKQLSLIRNRHALTETIVTKSLISDYHLIQHFIVLRKVLLMESGNLIQNFYSFLFKEMAGKNWRNARGLTMQLVLSIEGEHPELGANFSVMIRDEDSNNHKTPIAEICDISIGYTVEWPVSMVISPDAIAHYNSIFSFLLCIKYAFWSLYNLRFSDLNITVENTLKLKRLFVLKMWLQHCVTAIHFYFMGHVLHSYATQLEETVQQAVRIDDIINAHHKFLSAVQEHCLQNVTSAVLKQNILQTLELCPMLESLWRLEIEGKLTEDDIAELEDKYMQAHNTLSSILEYIIENASELSYNIGHLAELSSEIKSSLPESRYDEV